MRSERMLELVKRLAKADSKASTLRTLRDVETENREDERSVVRLDDFSENVRSRIWFSLKTHTKIQSLLDQVNALSTQDELH